MLQLKQITKVYPSAAGNVEALRGVDLSFRRNEFVSILGQSGCGKTTLLNVIGGLDHYTSGDLIINRRSTKEFVDSDWDAYRNHSIGFVFQTYNLIPHQSVLANVELALTLSGVSRAERRAKAKAALEQVGLADQLHKRPNQMSGGQMQRVAIARALVNDPEILLADEPTGALDSATSLQIMEILKEVAKERLVIMVTHNPDLAEAYSTRIIRLLDGQVVSDSNPCTAEELAAMTALPTQSKKEQKKRKEKKTQRTTMSFFTALSLSFNNLMTKKGRSFLTSFAGSIGIIGIALILSVSTGVQAYINSVQRDTLSTYPLSIQRETQDYSAMLSAMTQVGALEGVEIDPGKIYVDDSLGSMMSAMSATTLNNLEKFKAYLEENADEIKNLVSDIQYTYDFDLQLFTADGKTQVNPTTIFDNMGDAFAGISEMVSMSDSFKVMSEMINNQELLDQQYELVGEGSHWPSAANEVVLVINQNNQISKMALYMLGVLNQAELEDIMNGLMTDGSYDSIHMEPYDIKEFLGREFLLLNTADFYTVNEKAGTYTVDGVEYPIWTDVRKGVFDQEEFVTQKGTKIVISGIVRPREGVSATSITGVLGYTKALTDHILDLNTQSAVIQQQKQTPAYNVLSGLKFERRVYTREDIHELIAKVDDATMEQLYAYMTQQILSNEEFSSMLVVKDQESFLGFFSIMPADRQAQILSAMLQAAKANDPTGASLGMLMQMITATMDGIEVTPDNYLRLFPLMSTEQVMMTLVGMPGQAPMPSIPGLITLCGQDVMEVIYEEMTASLKELKIDEKSFTLLLQENFISDRDFVAMEEMLYKLAPQTDATYDTVLEELGDAEKAKPAAIHFYAKDFESKDRIESFITAYNNSVEEKDQMKYTDIVGVMMSSITTIINAISYVLIAFVAISLVVSSIMIGIITYISVLERTKEIGILRAIGASKANVASVFNAETLTIGFVSGVIGILVTCVLVLLINIILFLLTGIPELQANLPFGAALILIGISMLLTFIAGLVPSSIAAKKDPVVALRSE